MQRSHVRSNTISLACAPFNSVIFGASHAAPRNARRGIWLYASHVINCLLGIPFFAEDIEVSHMFDEFLGLSTGSWALVWPAEGMSSQVEPPAAEARALQSTGEDFATLSGSNLSHQTAGLSRWFHLPGQPILDAYF